MPGKAYIVKRAKLYRLTHSMGIRTLVLVYLGLSNKNTWYDDGSHDLI